MLFNSYAFILLFLPLTVAAYHLCQALRRPRTAIAVLVLASLLFYAWWSVRGLALLAVLMITNFAVASWLIRTRAESAPKRNLILVAGIAGNLITLGYFKYANFFLDGWAWAPARSRCFSTSSYL